LNFCVDPSNQGVTCAVISTIHLFFFSSSDKYHDVQSALLSAHCCTVDLTSGEFTEEATPASDELLCADPPTE